MSEFKTLRLPANTKFSIGANSYRIVTSDGYYFFHPKKMVFDDQYSSSKSISYTENWNFTLRKSELVDGEWEEIESISVTGSEIEDHFDQEEKVFSLFTKQGCNVKYTPPELEPLTDVTIPECLIDPDYQHEHDPLEEQ